jgi:GTP pyrophosphokinase
MAFDFAYQLHAQQLRKGTKIPYIAHLLAVSALVLEAGGDEDQVIAALLHDAAEDQGGKETLEIIRKRFGERVASIVEGCSDTLSVPKPPWRKRKETYLEHLQDAPKEVRLVSLADKLHNARSILREVKQYGSETFDKFNGGKSGTLWYYAELVESFKQTENNFLIDELVEVVEQIRNLSEK